MANYDIYKHLIIDFFINNIMKFTSLILLFASASAVKVNMQAQADPDTLKSLLKDQIKNMLTSINYKGNEPISFDKIW